MDVHLDGVAVDFFLPAVQTFFELRARQWLAGLFEQGAQQGEFARRDLEGLASEAHAVARRIEFERTVTQHGLTAAAAPAQQGADAGAEFVEVERFHEVIVGAGIECLHPLAHGVARGQDQHRQVVAGGAQFAQHRYAILARQAEVEQDEGVVVVAQGCERGDAVLDPVHGVVILAQRSLHGTAQHRIVFGEEEAHGGDYAPARCGRAHCCTAADLTESDVRSIPPVLAMSAIRTRFAPSPTGYLHIGGARTALFSWAYARHHDGVFVLRIEDTDVERSTPEAVQAILDGMAWLGLGHDEGPFYQMQRMDRYRAVIDQLVAAGHAYPCYTSPEELEAMRDAMRARGEKPRYDGRWRPEPGKTLPAVPDGVQPVIRFRNPTEGAVGWKDLVKGPISVANSELDDLIIARADGTPTYNFCVVVDDFDMGITHVIRGDDHVNNTPRQINILRALGAQVPQYAHLSMILGDDGSKLSKRHGAVSVMQYHEDGYLPEAVINYLARLGWSHGDDEIFSREQFVSWFDLDHITPSAAQFNTEKLNWLNAQYLRNADRERLHADIGERLARRGVATETVAAQPVAAIIDLYRERVSNLNELADAVELFARTPQPSEEQLATHFNDAARAALVDFHARLRETAWEQGALNGALKETLKTSGLKMPQVAIPLRVALLGVTQTPSIDAVLAVMGRETVMARIEAAITA